MMSSHSVKDGAIVVLGCTGVGKTRLSVQLAQEFNGEVVSADSMQLYSGLPVITNVATEAERCGIPHHLIEVANADTVYTVHKFVADALKVITAIRTRGKVPIIVGGTNYYIEALIFEDSLLSATTAEGSESAAVDSDRNDHRTSSAKRCGTAQHVEQESITGTLYSKLKQIDPDMAERLHPNDSRKISRSLDVFHTTGKPHSKWLAEQPRETSLRSVVGKKIACIWIKCDQAVLDARLDGRVDTMLEQGLLQELRRFTLTDGQTMAGEGGGVVQHVVDKIQASQGIFQAIGFKEFLPYFQAVASGIPLTAPDNVGSNCCTPSRVDGDASVAQPHADIFAACVDDMKRNTRRYARKQTRWVRNRLLYRHVTGLHQCQVDSTNVTSSASTQWHTDVFLPAKTHVASVYSNSVHSDGQKVEVETVGSPSLESDQGDTQWRKYTCEKCNGQVLNGRHEWDVHLRSKKHRKRKPRHVAQHGTESIPSDRDTQRPRADDSI